MATLRCTIQFDLDGEPIPGLNPIARRLTITELQPFLPYIKANDGDTTTYTSAPVEQVASVKGFVIAPDQAIRVKLDASATPVEIDSGGLLIGFGVTVDAGAATNITLNNNSGSAANVRGFGAG